jgi:hypothetical protein
MAAVDHCIQAAALPAETKAAEFTCTACAECFATSVDQRAHFKSERHVYNTKRKQAGLKPISQEAWERKLRESRSGVEQKGIAHLKAKKPTRKESAADSQVSETRVSEATAPEPEEPLTPRRCLFDRKRFDSIDLCLAYMEKTYSFFIPDREYCSDIPGLLQHLGSKVSEYHVCIHCNRSFPDLASVRRHMIDKGHTQLASEAYTRRGNIDEGTTRDMQEELEPFYDYSSSMREVAQRISDPQQKIASILRFFDADKDLKLGPDEVANLWAAATEGAKLSEAQYEGACAMGEANPKDGLDVEALAKLYAGGFADLDEHFAMLQDLLIKSKKKSLKTVLEDDNEDEGESEEEEDAEDGDSEDSEGDEDEVVECEDEDEFEEVMRVLGLQPVSITDTGDMRLPNGSLAAHRDVAYIYRQRGTRMTGDQLEVTGSQRRPQKRAQLMLSNASASGCLKIAVSQRQMAKEGKRIIAVLRKRNHEHLRMGIRNNMVMHNRKISIRTGRGDCSNGR